jgi:hypothetical protein
MAVKEFLGVGTLISGHDHLARAFQSAKNLNRDRIGDQVGADQVQAAEEDLRGWIDIACHGGGVRVDGWGRLAVADGGESQYRGGEHGS